MKNVCQITNLHLIEVNFQCSSWISFKNIMTASWDSGGKLTVWSWGWAFYLARASCPTLPYTPLFSLSPIFHYSLFFEQTANKKGREILR